ncbi:hypothetical protein LXH13_21235 [Streptomyces spinosirectus]|jgi:hypothetical protein|uniref:hypothetical protein n=1 Tax=Streptomyces TaxID=1883 RepID=UPI0019D43443|nr:MULTISPECIES: hypothetical protein [Streptomyces]MBY8345211.1 hypothetical protein [Streptomyces plumbidurans]UIR19418.1 hypothetical protein LXH13_21235 [Streptomyces spinosirectus]
MNTPARPRLKSITPTPGGPPHAPQPVDTTAVGAPKGAARQGVRTCPDPQTAAPGDPTPEQPGIRISAPPVYRHHYDGARWSKRLGATPTAAYACACGRTGNASGRDSVAALAAAYDAHRDTCPLRAPQEGRAAA